MLLGQLIKGILASEDASLAGIEGHDLVLAVRVHEAAARQGCTPGAYIAAAIRGFLASEDAETWTTALSRAQDSAEPGLAFVAAVVRRRLAADEGA